MLCMLCYSMVIKPVNSAPSNALHAVLQYGDQANK